MSQQLIVRSPDLKQLRDEGYEIEVKGGYLLIHHIPYVNSSIEVKFGTLVSTLTMSGSRVVSPDNHVIHFIGEHPCEKDGKKMTGIQHTTGIQNFGNGIVVDHSFSNKPNEGYPDYYKKVTRYEEMISAQARAIDNTATAKTFKPIIDSEEESVFQYIDTNSSRANINLISEKFEGQKIVIIGLGGTGAYILDLVAKTPVSEIHLYDGDKFLVHNAFRSPGAASIDELDMLHNKTDYYKSGYSNMHKHIISHPYYIDEFNISEIAGANYVFLAIDKEAIKKTIIDFLLSHEIPFFDVGLGVNTVDDCLVGTLRVTTGTKDKNDHLASRISCGDDVNNEYATNIQIADLNSLNAVLAVIKWKKLSGFYQDLKQEHNTSYSINVSQLTNDDTNT
ncbi:MAG: ThiF family adenylyltransferase [Paludibacter sp.]|nr:ThiF family adenylyltransferase [Paludibacter sp.]